MRRKINNEMNEKNDSAGHLLIVDNDENVLKSTTELLREAGYSCTPARDGLEALKALKSIEYDLLITEVRMSGHDDLELVRAAGFYAPNMPVIILTAHPSLASAITATHLRVGAYLVQPVETSTLLQHVRTGIADHRALKHKEILAERSMVFTWAVEETIQILADTQRAFKSRRLSGLRRKLERIVASGCTE